MPSLNDYAVRCLPLIETDLKCVLALPDGAPPLFYAMLHYHMGWVDEHDQPVDAHGGKRIRPLLTLLVSEAVCGSVEPARPAASAVELIHNFSLLHDDIQDGSPTRRNRSTVWTIWGKPQAINAGDALFALAHLAIPRLASADLDGGIVARMLTILDATCLELTRGQHLDISFETRKSVSADEYLDMITGKTAALISACAQLGALAAGASADAQTHYRAFGHNLGMAFQVRDDILDIWGDAALTGKEPAVDIRQRKKSLPVLYALSRSAALRHLYAQPDPFDEAAVERAVSLLNEIGARPYAEDLARQYSSQTVSELEAASPHGPAGEALYELVEQLLHRKH